MTKKNFWATLALAATILISISCGSTSTRTSESSNHSHDEEHGHDHDHDHGYEESKRTVEINADAQRRAGVVAKKLERGSLDPTDRFVATVKPVDQKVAHIRPIARGRLVQVLANIGDRVTRDQRLAVYDNIEAGEVIAQLEAARAEAAKTEVQRTLAEKQAERARTLFEVGAIPARMMESAVAEAKAMEEAEKAIRSVVRGLETRLSRFGDSWSGNVLHSDISAPFSGVIIQSEAAVGEIADPSSVIFSVADLTEVYADAQVYEKDLSRFHVGQPVQVTTDAFPGEVFNGKVESVKHILDPHTRTATVRCLLPNPNGLLKLEMYAQVSLPSRNTGVLLLPSSAIQQVEGKQVIFRRVAADRFEMREVATRGSGPLVELVSGADENDEIVVAGAFQVKSVMLASELHSEHSHD
mgnify:CR=1 FL=1